MSFTPTLKPEMRRKAPAIVHHDGTSLPQTLTTSQDPWLMSVLAEIETQTGTPVVINTAFRAEGKPIINSIKDAIKVLADSPVVKYLVVDDFLFSEASAIDRSQPLKVLR
jgi:carbamoyltransferase